ncbi:MAG: cell surface protein [Methylobacteriaceae bacterium]|nr:cell surface protein [Methylobacteriaceae bacterium]
MMAIRQLGLTPVKVDDAPIIAILKKLTDVEPDKVAIISRTLQQMSVFNEAVREQVAEINIGSRYEDIARAFDSIRDDAKRMVDQLDDSKIDLFERVTNVWMKISRGDVADRFDVINKNFIAVSKDTKEAIDRETLIYEAYNDFRGALKHGEIAAHEIYKKVEDQLNTAKAALQSAADAVAAAGENTDLGERAKLELVRDEALRAFRDTDARFQVAKDLRDNLTIAYNTSEVIMARLLQSTNAKERVYQQAVTFFSTNEVVFTALKATFTGLFSLHEATQTLNVMKEGANKSLEVLAEIGGKIQEEALKAGYGPTIRVDAVKKLVDSVVSFQERSVEIVDEMRKLATKNSEEIRDAVEDGRKRMIRLAQEGNVLEPLK